MWTAEAVLACALTLLGRSVSSFPPIEFVTTLPADASPQTEAYVRVNDKRIFLVTTGLHFQVLCGVAIGRLRRFLARAADHHLAVVAPRGACCVASGGRKLFDQTGHAPHHLFRERA